MLLRDAVAQLDFHLRPGLAESWDKVGLLAGDTRMTVRRVGVALDPSEDILAVAARKKINLLITHHPLFLRAPENLALSARTRGLYSLIRNDVALYCAHTNFDALPWGTAGALCSRLKLRPLRPLSPIRIPDKKVVTFAPPDAVSKIHAAMTAAGAGQIGAYSGCAFAARGEGVFLPNSGARPAIGRPGVWEKTPEDRLEMVVPADRLSRVLTALRQAHPYEEPAIDVSALETNNERYGFGFLAETEKAVFAGAWLQEIKRTLQAEALEVWGYRRQRIRRVAVMPGAGSLFAATLPAECDAFLTGELKYHEALQLPRGVLGVVAGHDLTEQPGIDALRIRLTRILGQAVISIKKKNKRTVI